MGFTDSQIGDARRSMDYPMFYSYDTSILNQQSPCNIIIQQTRIESDDIATTADFLTQSGLILVNNTILYRWECLNDYTAHMGTFAALATRIAMTRQKIIFTNDKSPRFTVCVPISTIAIAAIARLQSAIKTRRRQKHALAFAMASHSRLGDSVVSSLSRILDEPSMLMLILGFPL